MAQEFCQGYANRTTSQSITATEGVLHGALSAGLSPILPE